MRMSKIILGWSGLAGLAVFLFSPPAVAQTIYPLTRAEILAGAKFDFKVEFPGNVAAPDIKVTVNGRDAAAACSAKAATVDGQRGRTRPHRLLDSRC